MKPAQQKARLGRLLAVQCIYSALAKDSRDFLEVLESPEALASFDLFDEEDLGGDGEDRIAKPDRALTRKILTHMQSSFDGFHTFLSTTLITPHQFIGLNLLMKSLVYSAAVELYMGKAPVAVVVDEYLHLSHGFFSQDETRLIHGLLTTVIKNEKTLKEKLF